MGFSTIFICLPTICLPTFPTTFRATVVTHIMDQAPLGKVSLKPSTSLGYKLLKAFPVDRGCQGCHQSLPVQGASQKEPQMKEVCELTKAGGEAYFFSTDSFQRTRFSPLYLPCCQDSATLGFSPYSLSLTFLCDANISGTFFFFPARCSRPHLSSFSEPFSLSSSVVRLLN